MITNPDQHGRTRGGRYTYRPLIQPEPDDFPPDSLYWRRCMESAALTLLAAVGNDIYQDWIEHNLTDTDTAKECYDKIIAHAELSSLIRKSNQY